MFKSRQTILGIAATGLMVLNPSSVLAASSSAARASLNICSALFIKGQSADLGLGVNWVPYSRNVETPPVFNDRVVHSIIKNEAYRVYLLEQAKAGHAIMTDYKQLTDATPLYKTTPKLPDSAIREGRTNPDDFTFSELTEYIKSNYKLAQNAVTNKAFFTKEEKVADAPLMQALERQGLIPKLRPGQKTRDQGQVEAALRKLHQTWEDLLRQSPEETVDTLLPMPNKYVVAGGRFRESYYWDSFWIMKGLLESGYGNTAKGMLENFVSLYERYGIIPNGNRFYYLTRSQLPVFMEMAKLLENHKLLDFSNRQLSAKGSTALEARVIDTAEKYYVSIWKKTDRFNKATGLFHFSDGAGGVTSESRVVIRPEAGLLEPRSKEKHSQRVFAESGWDMSYSRFGKRPQDWLPVDLNFTLLAYNEKLSDILKTAGRTAESEMFAREASRIKVQVDKYLLDPSTGLYVDYNHVEQRRSTVTTAASFFAFYAGAYENNASSQSILRRLYAKLKPQGHLAVHTTDTEGEGQWDGSWAWAPLNEVAFQALVKYDLKVEATNLAFDYSVMTIAAYHNIGHTFYEKYQAKDGSINLPKDTEIYGNEEGFGWTNGATEVFLKHLADNNLLPQLEAEVAKRTHKQ